MGDGNHPTVFYKRPVSRSEILFTFVSCRDLVFTQPSHLLQSRGSLAGAHAIPHLDDRPETVREEAVQSHGPTSWPKIVGLVTLSCSRNRFSPLSGLRCRLLYRHHSVTEAALLCLLMHKRLLGLTFAYYSLFGCWRRGYPTWRRTQFCEFCP
jgi:hypothetical protein